MAEVYPVPFVELDKQDAVLRRLKEAGADGIHWDVMDGRYNRNNTMETMGPERIARARRYIDLPFEAHLMIAGPWERVREYVDAGVDTLIPHVEAFRPDRGQYDNERIRRFIEAVQDAGKKAGLALEPDTPSEVVPDFSHLDLVLVMTVPTGYSGQPFQDQSEKIRRLAEIREEDGYHYLIDVDGGMNTETSVIVRGAGARRIVAASYILKSEDYGARIRELRGE